MEQTSESSLAQEESAVEALQRPAWIALAVIFAVVIVLTFVFGFNWNMGVGYAGGFDPLRDCVGHACPKVTP